MNENSIPLHMVPIGKKAKVENLLSIGAIRRRLQDIGIVEGTLIECLYKGPSGEPAAYLIKGAVIAIRSEDSSKILVYSE